MSVEIEVFASASCPSCARAVAAVETVAAELGPAVTWRRRDVVEHIDRAVGLGVRAVPAIVIAGELVATGVPSAASLRAALRGRLATNE